MGRGQRTLWIVIGILVVVVLIPFLYVKSTYNTLVRMDEQVKAAWAQVENQLQRRYDLIPNYVETVKGYAKHEKEVFIKVTEARSKVAGAASIPEKIRANNELSAALSRLLVVVERYPELKANTNFIRLQDELAGTENRIAVERRRFNEAVRVYNTKLRTFPTNIIATLFGFEKATFFQVPKEKQEVPKVKF
ncbi:MAG: LemA family protein [Deltaproteobacteria bacterium]|nr:LemA family protein [Deltaproteobacteria bacterium]MBW1927767.1 LemA family protein [Deltaproteobacteria bacterium]MBW2024076.1 LemA family protein [Deltaproteobacteria bacterium]MBW2124874.1 LemA family protein [Deltaproteobacteria bacterium]RLB24483.1 MAG: LemA family protein [Deltaproteobacteria bacterium]